jgi:hypothetical protein
MDRMILGRGRRHEPSRRINHARGIILPPFHQVQSSIARLEGGKVRPSTEALERFAQATRTRLRLAFEPQPAR